MRIGTSVERASAVSEIRQKAEGYGIPNERLDGMDVLSVKKTAAKILGKIREGIGPYFLEVVTYRYRGHSLGDPERYRESDEVKKWQGNDPIGILHKKILSEKIATSDELAAIDERVEEEVQTAVQFAESSPDPDLSELYTYVYVGEYSD